MCGSIAATPTWRRSAGTLASSGCWRSWKAEGQARRTLGSTARAAHPVEQRPFHADVVQVAQAAGGGELPGQQRQVERPGTGPRPYAKAREGAEDEHVRQVD